MKRAQTSLALAAVVCSLLLGACTKSTDSSSTSSASSAPDATAAPSDEPTAAVTALAAATVAPAATTAAPATAAPAAVQAVSYTDIKGAFGEKEITQLASLGVFGDATGTFAAAKPIMRREFVRWLFKANNAIWANDPNNLVHPAQGGDSSFTDIPTSDADEQYIQGLQDAGISVGFPDKTFKPDVPITREQALAIKSVLDRGGVDPAYVITKKDPNYGYYRLPPWKDKKEVSPEYVGAIATAINDDSGAANEINYHVMNVQRTFGAIAALKPKAALTRGQAALMLWEIGPHVREVDRKTVRSAAEALAPAASPTP